MTLTLTDLREIYGSVYVTETPDGTIVPFKILSIQDYFDYDSLFRANQIDHSLLENEIFTKCVLDPILIKNIAVLKAGTVTLVAKSIMDTSGPQSIDDFNTALDTYRNIAQEPIHQLVSLICRAFPGYTPDDVYQMDFHKMLLRLAQAESKLLELGMLKEPIFIGNGEEVEEKEKPKFKLDPKAIKEAFDKQGQKPPKKVNLSKQKEIEHLEESLPADLTKDGKTVISTDSLRERFAAGADMEDMPLLEHEMKKSLPMYSDYLKQGNKVKIKSHEERVKEAFERREANRKKNIEAAKKKTSR